MRVMGRLGAALALAGLVLATAARADDGCRLDCVTSVTGCIAQARVARIACRKACTDGACRRQCRVDARAARAACRGDGNACRTACPGSSDAGAACASGCGTLGATCQRDLAQQAKTCVHACRVGSEPVGPCVAACADTLASGAGQCRATVTSCRAGCGDAPGGGACRDACATAARGCDASVLAALPGCARDCRRAGGVLPACLAQCASGLCACVADLHACVAGCGSPAGAFLALPGLVCGSPSGAFL
jgi:hypothetical protein